MTLQAGLFITITILIGFCLIKSKEMSIYAYIMGFLGGLALIVRPEGFIASMVLLLFIWQAELSKKKPWKTIGIMAIYGAVLTFHSWIWMVRSGTPHTWITGPIAHMFS